MDAPVALWKFPQLHCVIADWGQTVAAGLPGQQHLASLHLLLGDGWTASGLRAGCVDWRVIIKWRVETEQEVQQSLGGGISFLASPILSDTHARMHTHTHAFHF